MSANTGFSLQNDPNRLATVRFDYDADLVALRREVMPRASWDSRNQEWSAGLETIEAFLVAAEALLKEQGRQAGFDVRWGAPRTGALTLGSAPKPAAPEPAPEPACYVACWHKGYSAGRLWNPLHRIKVCATYEDAVAVLQARVDALPGVPPCTSTLVVVSLSELPEPGTRGIREGAILRAVLADHDWLRGINRKSFSYCLMLRKDWICPPTTTRAAPTAEYLERVNAKPPADDED